MRSLYGSGALVKPVEALGLQTRRVWRTYLYGT